MRVFNKIVNIGEKVNNRILLHESITSLEKLVVSYKEYVIGFEFAALHFQSPKNNRYAFKLEGFDKDWNFVDDQRLATYTNLPPGSYTFMVKAANCNGVWNNIPTTLKLIVKPAWWNTIFFKLFLILAIIITIFSFFRIRISMLKKRQGMLEEVVATRTEELSEALAQLEEKQEEVTIQNDELVRHRNDLENLIEERTIELKVAKEKAEESDRLKSAFLANMSHEIRTPMNAIVGFASLMDEEDIVPAEREYFIKTIKNNSDSLLTIINDILDISIIEANQLVLYKERFCVDEILDELKSYYNLKNQKQLYIEFVSAIDRKKTYLYR